MKVTRTHSIDHELVVKLQKELNASGLICDLLYSYYKHQEENPDAQGLIDTIIIEEDKKNADTKIKAKRDKESNKLKKAIEGELK